MSEFIEVTKEEFEKKTITEKVKNAIEGLKFSTLYKFFLKSLIAFLLAYMTIVGVFFIIALIFSVLVAV